MKQPCVYILANRRNGALYIGVTSDLLTRIAQHQEGQGSGFARRYGIKRLVWYELHGSMEGAILREKLLKKWSRERKLALIERQNPEWYNLADQLSPY